LVQEMILYHDARSEKHQNTFSLDYNKTENVLLT